MTAVYCTEKKTQEFPSESLLSRFNVDFGINKTFIA